MSRDYKSNKAAKNTKKSNGSLFLGLLIGYALGLISAIGIWMYISESPSPFLAPVKTSNQTVLEPIKAPSEKTEEEMIAAADAKNKFDFYHILPGVDEPAFEQEPIPVAQAPTPVIPSPISPPINPTITPLSEKPAESVQMEHYFLQAGSFRSTNDAENQKAKLALLGVVADIQSADLAEKGVWYRVRVGPFIRMNKVEEVRASLQLNGIDTHFIKISGNL
jgi:cell division septation protein DedD